MSIEDFWALVKQVRYPGRDTAEVCSELEAALQAMPQTEYLDFVHHFCRLHLQIRYSPVMINAAWLANEQCLSALDYFAYWLIFCGEDGFREAFTNPDSIIGLMEKFGDPNLDEVGGAVFARVNAENLPIEDIDTSGKSRPMLWSAEELAAAMPKLYAYGMCE